METDRFYLEAAMKEARQAFTQDTYPVGAIIVDPTGEIIGRGHNQVFIKGDFTSHAEVEAIREARWKLMLKQNYEKCTLYTTLEPCIMCCGALLHARIARVVWVRDDDEYGELRRASKNIPGFNEPYASRFEILQIDHAEEEDLRHEMDEWMCRWNDMKKGVVANRMSAELLK